MPKTLNKDDWEHLSQEQKDALTTVEKAVQAHIDEETAAFYKTHPELRLIWRFALDVWIRSKHDTAQEDKP